MKVNVKLNPIAIKKLEEAAIKSLPLTAEATKTEISNMKVVPKETGNLEESASVGSEGNTAHISWNTPYARRLYYHPEYNFRKDKNPNAQGRWADSFQHGPKKDWLAETYGKFLKQQSGGVIK
jgi:hypothetical protein